jgi:hypothetical protein
MVYITGSARDVHIMKTGSQAGDCRDKGGMQPLSENERLVQI